MKEFKIQDRVIGGKDVFIIAELSANHNQDFDVAVKTLRAMKESGADAVKLQTYTADTLTIDCDNEHFKIDKGTLWDGKTLYELYEEAYTPWDWQPKLKKLADELGLICFSSPFDNSAVDFLEKMQVPAYKIASFEITDIPLIEYVAAKGKPVILSTGIAELEDIEAAVQACKSVGSNEISLLKCTSAYPAPMEEVNLRTIQDLADRFNCVAGLSDHTLGISVPIAAVALGAKVIEKHFILDKSLGGPDANFSLDPSEFKQMVTAVRETEKSVGNISYALSEKVQNNRIFARSLFVVEAVKAGEEFTSSNTRSIRPGYGLSPARYPDVLGRVAKVDIEPGTPLSEEHF